MSDDDPVRLNRSHMANIKLPSLNYAITYSLQSWKVLLGVNNGRSDDFTRRAEAVDPAEMIGTRPGDST